MPTFITGRAKIEAAGDKPKLINEYVGWAPTRTDALSIAHMRSPGGRVEPGQTPEFDEYTIVLKGLLRVKHADGVIAGDISYDKARKLLTIPVKLKANWSYKFWLNSQKFTAFRSRDGVPLEPLEVTFETRGR